MHTLSSQYLFKHSNQFLIFIHIKILPSFTLIHINSNDLSSLFLFSEGFQEQEQKRLSAHLVAELQLFNSKAANNFQIIPSYKLGSEIFDSKSQHDYI